MNDTHSRPMAVRTAVRLASFGLALLLVLSGLAVVNFTRARQAQRLLQYQYLRSINDLGTYLENIETALTKTMYAGTSPTMTQMTSKLWRESGFAKECVATLPMNELHLENTYKFLSQLGDYSVSLSRKMEQGETVTEEEQQNLQKLKTYTTQFLQNVLVLEDGLRSGTITFDEVKQDAQEITAVSAQEGISGGFTEFEEGFTSYPTLIYDGPFSDHILQKEPEMTKNAEEVSEDDARQKAAEVCGVSADALETDTAEQGNMPSYCFKADGLNVAITKQGGYLSYFIKNRAVGDRSLSVEDACTATSDYVSSLGVGSFKQTYYEISGGQITVNFAHVENEVVCYTDLIKVTAAMDTGEITRCDARGYVMNHKERGNLQAQIPQAQAAEAVSSLLTINRVQMALIPDEGLNEVLCYEFLCTSNDEQNVLVYVNAETGAEQQILVLYIDENGTLTL